MNLDHMAPILTDELREIVAERAKIQTELQGIVWQDSPDAKRHKKRKLILKELAFQRMGKISVSQFKPVDPALFIMTDDELGRELLRRERTLRRRIDRVGETSFELSDLKSLVRDVNFEIDRRSLQSLFDEEQQEAEAA